MLFKNVVIGKSLLPEWMLISETEEEFENFDKRETLWTEERFLPRILVEAGVAKSITEVRKNKPDLVRELNNLDCEMIKWGKKRIFIIVGES